MRSTTILIVLLLGFIATTFNSCSKSNLPPFPVVYTVTFVSDWNAQDHGTLPPGAHFSPLIGMTHDKLVNLYVSDSLATAGIEQMAETGVTTNLQIEINRYFDFGHVADQINGESFNVPGTTTDTFGVDNLHTRVSLVSMIAPSPDWFVGIRNLDLKEGGDWIDFKEVVVVPYDAGTDSGTDFNSPNQDSNPTMNIAVLATGPLAQNGTVAPMGRFKFQRIQ